MEEYVTFNKTNFTYKDITMTYEELDEKLEHKRDIGFYIEKSDEIGIPYAIIDKILIFYDFLIKNKQK